MKPENFITLEFKGSQIYPNYPPLLNEIAQNSKEFLGKLIKAYSKMLQYKIRLIKKDRAVYSVLAGRYISDISKIEPQKRLFDVIVELITFHEVYGEFFVFKTVNAQLDTTEPDTFDIDSIFDEPIYLPDNTVMPNLQKATVKILTQGVELLGLYTYILISICEFFDISLSRSSSLEHFALDFRYQYGLPSNLFESGDFQETISYLQDILIKIDKAMYIKDPDYFLLYSLIYDFLKQESGGLTLPLYDLWEYLCLNHYASTCANNQAILFFDLEDKLYYLNAGSSINSPLKNNTFTVKFQFCGTTSKESIHYLRPDLIIYEKDNEKAYIKDMKLKKEISSDDRVAMDLYRICVGTAIGKKIECKFVLPKADSSVSDEDDIEYKAFTALLNHFVDSGEGIDELIDQTEKKKYKNVSGSSQTACLKHLKKILALLKSKNAYEINNNTEILIDLNKLNDSHNEDELLKCCLSILPTDRVKINDNDFIKLKQ